MLVSCFLPFVMHDETPRCQSLLECVFETHHVGKTVPCPTLTSFCTMLVRTRSHVPTTATPWMQGQIRAGAAMRWWAYPANIIGAPTLDDYSPPTSAPGKLTGSQPPAQAARNMATYKKYGMPISPGPHLKLRLRNDIKSTETETQQALAPTIHVRRAYYYSGHRKTRLASASNYAGASWRPLTPRRHGSRWP